MHKKRILYISNSLNSDDRWTETFPSRDVDVVDASELDISLGPYERTDIDLVFVEGYGIAEDDVDLCYRLRQRFDVPILLLTRHYTEEFAVNLYKAGVDECIAGHIGRNLLRAKVNAWLRWLDRTRAQHTAPASVNRVWVAAKHNDIRRTQA